MTRVALLRYPGTWSERDFEHAFSLVPDVQTEILWHEDADLRGFDAAIVPGGFTYGDYLRAGAIAKISPATKALRRFAEDGKPVLGSCNGFQILCEAGLLPGALLRNAGLEYRCEWVHIRVEQDATPWTAGLGGRVLRMPIGHGEGCFVADADTIAALEERRQVVFRYTDARGAATAEANPNGSAGNIAGVMNEWGNVVGLMPHPERASDVLLGSSDGVVLLKSLLAAATSRATLLV